MSNLHISSATGEEGIESTAGMAGPVLQLNGTPFKLSRDLVGLMKCITAEGRGALRMPAVSYRQVRLSLAQELSARFGKDSRQYKDLTFAGLYCAGCRWEYPESYRNSLFLGEMLEQQFGAVQGAVPGHREFGKTGRCPLCQCEEAVLVFECFLPQEISEANLADLKRYWQQQAMQWWRVSEERQLSCATCGSPLLRNMGYLFGVEMLCETCIQKELEDGVRRLQDYPHLFGNNLLRKARSAQR